MTYAGARGNTAKQMAEVLHFNSEQEKLPAIFAEMIKDINARGTQGNYQLSVANALWGQKGYKFLKEFIDLVNDNYGAGLNEVDFKNATEEARKIINTWVEEKTNGKIKDLIPKGILNNLTRLLLTNAIYFKGNWAAKFKMTYECRLADTLKSMGIIDAFIPPPPPPGISGADFSGMTGNKDLCFSEVIHKAFIDVNEEGTEAAAATAVAMMTGGIVTHEPLIFKADHPFLFLYVKIRQEVFYLLVV